MNMLHRILHVIVPWRVAPEMSASKIEPALTRADRLTVIREIENDDGTLWSEVEAVREGLPPRRGFVRAELIAVSNFEDAGAALQEITDKTKYISVLTLAAVRFQTNRDYLAAVAHIESGMSNKRSANSEARGPFQFMPSTWERIVEQDKRSSNPVGVSAGDIDNPTAQAFMAARLTAENVHNLLEARGRLPTGAELYCAHLFGEPAGRAVLAGLDNGGTATIDKVLKDFYAGTSLGAAFADKIMAQNSALLARQGAPLTIGELLEVVVEKFDAAAKALAEPISLLPADLRVPSILPADMPPWLAVARAELGVEEVLDTGNNPRIQQYHDAAGAIDVDSTPWCGSFIAFCLEQTGHPKILVSNLHSKRAADWMNWGSVATDPPVGALCVLTPQAPGSSGHVGFYVRHTSDTSKVVLLGGNQGKPGKVSEEAFAAADVRSFRWLDWT